MNRLLLFAVAVLFSSFAILFSSPALAVSPPRDYTDGEVLVTVHAPPFCGNVDVYAQALQEQAESFAERFQLELLRTTYVGQRDRPRDIDMQVLVLFSDYKTTEELIQEIQSHSHPDVVDVAPNWLVPPGEWRKSSGCNVGYGGILSLLAIYASVTLGKKAKEEKTR